MSFPLYDKIRLFFKNANIFGHENIFQNQNDISKVFKDGGALADLTDPSFFIEQTNVQINRLERYKDYDQMDEVGEISLALDLYADEASLRDPERNHSVFVKTKSIRLKKEIDDFLYNTLNIDQYIRPATRYLCKYGDWPVEIVANPERTGVARIEPMFVYNFTRVETRHGDLVGFFYQLPGEEPEYFHPWQVSHMRLSSFEQIFQPYGKSILDGARRDFRRLRLMEDAALVYRLVRAPEKRVFKVPVGNLPPKEREQYIEIIARRFKKHKFIDPATGAMNERYAPHIQDDDYWIPVTADGTGVEIDTLQGAENLDAIADIEYFKKKMVSALKIPFERVGMGEASGEQGRSIASTSPSFAKAVQWIQDQIIVGVKKIVLVHLALRGYTVDMMKDFELAMTSASAIDELYRAETWATRVDLMGGLKDLQIFPDEWIVSRFTDLTQDELELVQKQMKYKIDDMKKEEEKENKEAEQEEENFFESVRKLEREHLLLEIRDLKDKIVHEQTQYSRYNTVYKMLAENEFDGLTHNGAVIVSSVEDRMKVISEAREMLSAADDDAYYFSINNNEELVLLEG